MEREKTSPCDGLNEVVVVVASISRQIRVLNFKGQGQVS